MDILPKRTLLVAQILGIFVLGVVNCQSVKSRENGAYIGKLATFSYEVSGTVWALDEDTIFIKDFNYNGKGPDGWFWMGEGNQPNPQGFIVPYPLNSHSKKVLPKIVKKDIVLKLPPGKKIPELGWFSVWCRRFTVDFGSVKIPSNLVLPKKRQLPEFSRLAHRVRSGNVTILDAKTFYIPDFHYDGAGPDAFFWVGKGEPSPSGQKIPNEVGSLDILRGYQGEDIELVLPGELTVYDIDYLSVWCVLYRHNFGQVNIPQELWVPPAKGQTNLRNGRPIAEDDGTIYNPDQPDQVLTPAPAFPNCMELSPLLQVEWEARKDDVQIRLSAKIEESQYVAFGLSGNPNKPQMINADVVVAYYDKDDGSFNAFDYAMSTKSQCSGGGGVCPDTAANGLNDAEVISGDRSDGITTITYTRPYSKQDRFDLDIPQTSVSSAVVAAIGPLNDKKEANYHQTYVTKEIIKIDFTSRRVNECSQFSPIVPRINYRAWDVNKLIGISNFTVNMGPTGGQKGYQAITGHASWGIAWWINGYLIPEIYVERGSTYHFTVEGGDDPERPAKYHPFYITDSVAGGYGNKKAMDQKEETIYAGVTFPKDERPRPLAVGRICEYEHKGIDTWMQVESFAEYAQTVDRKCAPGSPGSLEWTVPENAPDLLYYQCYTHRHLGWKIHVVDPGANEIFRSSTGILHYTDTILLVTALFSVLITSIGSFLTENNIFNSS